MIEWLPTGELTLAMNAVHQLFVHVLVPVFPGLAADHVLRGGRIKMAIGKPLLHVPLAVN
jgi:hypothetical protein